MSLIDEYKQQYAWRSWPTILDALPDVADQTIYDLGCAVGDQSAELAARGACVIGIDANDEMLDAARLRRIGNVEFRRGNLADLRTSEIADGIWSSFTAAYFPNLTAVLSSWRSLLRPSGWIALVEVDDLFAHTPITPLAEKWLSRYVDEADRNSRYDFKMGRKLADKLQSSGFQDRQSFCVPDQEFAFAGSASDAVVEAWRKRFDRMTLLREFCGDDFEQVRDDFLRCLQRPDHKSQASVCCCIAARWDE